MMSAVRALLLDLGVTEAKIKTEAFISPPASPLPAPSGNAGPSADGVGQPASVEIPDALDAGGGQWVRFQRSGALVDAPADRTILDAAEAAGIDLPFECRSGVCGQCKTRLVSGRVTMDSEDALTAAEKARGLILACQAHVAAGATIDA
jgi:ferredoxin